jgi:hypothetical protein
MQAVAAHCRQSATSTPHLPPPGFDGCPRPCDNKTEPPPPPRGLDALGWPPRRRWSRLDRAAALGLPWLGVAVPLGKKPSQAVGPGLGLSGLHGPVVPLEAGFTPQPG